MAPADDVEEIVNDGASGRRDDADAAREGRQVTFAGGVEEPLLLQLLLQLLECELQRACAYRLQRLGDELQLAALFVYGDAATHQDAQSSLGAKAEKRRLPPEKHHGKLTMFILEREIEVSGGGAAQIGYFAFDPAVGIGSLDVAADFCDECADGPDAPRLLLAAQAGKSSPNWSIESVRESLRVCCGTRRFLTDGCAKR